MKPIIFVNHGDQALFRWMLARGFSWFLSAY
jgi:hypothetical protein